MTNPANTARLQFGRFELQPKERQLLEDGLPVVLAPRAFDLLVVLVEHAGQLVTKDELLVKVWPGLVVEDNNLQVHVSALRKALGAEAIATIVGRGYRFTLGLEGPPPPNTMPKERTLFIGREQSLTDCARLLAGSRLLTLTGIGGSGKSRLAIKLAERLRREYSDGAWFVDLAPLQDAQRVPLALAEALGVTVERGASITERLGAHLATKRTLLVLDNCEHVIDVAIDLVEFLLRTCGTLRFIATSREGLGIAGEQIYPVRSLAMPIGADLPAIVASEAVQLFVDRARLAAPRFAIDATNAAQICDICRRLDGIPLAIELAAARVRILTVAEIQSKLDDRFRLLTGGSRAVPRHQTLQAAIQWSYEHLTSDEQRMFRLLSVFAGGATLTALAHVAGEDNDEFAVLDLLTRLSDKSLLAMDGTVQSGRYTMLETVRQYALERLNEAGERDAARMRHLNYYLALADEADPQLLGPGQALWSSRLDAERENLLVAREWCKRAAGGAAMRQRLAFALRNYWVFRGLVEQGYRMTMESLLDDDAQTRNLARCQALFAAGYLAHALGEYAAARGHGQESLAIAREIGDDTRISGGLLTLGRVSIAEGDTAAGRRYYEETLALARKIGHRNRICGSLSALADLHRALGELGAAQPLYEEALVLAREMGDPDATAVSLLSLGIVSIQQGTNGPAIRGLREALALVARVDLKRTGQRALDVCAGLGAALGDWKRAARIHGQSEACREQMNLFRTSADEAFLAPLMLRARKGCGDSAFAETDAKGRACGYEDALAEARAWLEPWKPESGRAKP